MNANALEAELVRNAKAGDLAAFEKLTKRHERRVYTLGLSEANVKVRLLRARLQLREHLTRILGDPTSRIERGHHHHE